MPHPAANPSPDAGPLVIRKYSNRRMYDQTRSRSIRQEELYDLVAAGFDVEVRDSTTGQDITNLVLAQVLMERDPTKLAAFPPAMLHLLIRTNERLLEGFLDRYFTGMTESLLAMRRQFESLVPDQDGGRSSLPATPFDWAMAALRSTVPPPATAPAPESAGLEALQEELRRLRSKVDELGATSKKSRAQAGKKVVGSRRSRSDRTK